MRKQLILSLIFLFFLIVLIKYSNTLYQYAVGCSEFVTADWLINYESGFVRRGLSGWFLIGLSQYLNIKANFIVMWTQLIIYLAFIGSLFSIIKGKEINIWFIIILVSPVTISMSISDPGICGRKEIILFLLYTIYLLYFDKKKLSNWFQISFLTAIFLIATLFHELFFFYCPYFVFAAYIIAKKSNRTFNIYKNLIPIFGSFIAIVTIYFYGINIDGSAICTSLLKLGLSDNICTGVLSWPSNYGANEVNFYAKQHEYYFNYPIAFLLGIIPFIFFIQFSKVKVVSPKLLFFLLLFALIFSVPLFIQAIDWGRWLNIHFTLLLITSTLFMNNKSSVEKNYQLEIPILWGINSPIKRILFKMGFIIVAILYLSTWNMFHFDSFSIISFHYYASISRLLNSIISVLL